MKTKEIPKGVYFALATAFISGFSIFVSKISVTVLPDPIAFTTLKNLIVALVLVGLVFGRGKLAKIRTLKSHEWRNLLLIGAVGGGLPFALFFSGLILTSAVSAAFIHKTLFVWVAILAVFFLKERLGILPGLALLILLLANLLFGGSSSLHFGFGELLVFLATLLWAIENMIAKKTLATVDPDLVATFRMGIGAIILLLIVVLQGNLSILFSISPGQIVWVLIPCLFLTGYVLTWYRALKFAPATIVASVLVLSTPITNILSAIFITQNFPASQFLNLLLVVVGITLIGILGKKIASISTPQLKTT